MNELEEKTKFLVIYKNIAAELTKRGYNAEAYLEESTQISDNAWDVGVRLTDEEAQWDPHVDILVVWEHNHTKWEHRRTNDIRVVTKTVRHAKKSWPQHNNGGHQYERIIAAWLVARGDHIARMTAEETRLMNESTVHSIKQELNMDDGRGHEGFDIQASVHAEKPCKIVYKTIIYGTTDEARSVMRRLVEAGLITSTED